jgi:SAM-dependent methyltransferase
MKCLIVLQGRRVIEYACGEGSAGVILSQLGCGYLGADIAPSAVKRARQALADYPDASVIRLDMVNERVSGVFDAAVDICGLHMLVTDSDRKKYLENIHAALKPGAPALFFRESYSEAAYSGVVSSLQEWKAITGDDYETPEERQVTHNGVTYSVKIPRIPARAKNKTDYAAEMTDAGFIVDQIVDMDPSKAIRYAASIYGHKGDSK